MSAWINMISDEDADEDLKEALSLARTPHGTVDNVMRVHSLRPNTMRGHLSIYRAALHDETNKIPTWFQETISSYVSILNKCEYSLANHWKNAAYLIGDSKKASKIKKALDQHKPENAFDGKELDMLNYARKLTLYPDKIVKSDIERLKRHGFDDGEILEANQIICYFNYVNRLINGLGVTTDGDTVGYYKES